MKLINANWEFKHFNVNTVEIISEYQDNIDIFLSFVKENESEYTVLKIPVLTKGFIIPLQNYGYNYIETNVQMTFNLSKNISSTTFTTVINNSKVIEISDINWLKEKIISDLIFEQDKISLDPFFSTTISNKRYSNWMVDLVESGKAKAYLVYFRFSVIGFFVLKKNSDFEYESFLAGLFKEYSSSGLGFLPIYYAIDYAKKNGAKILTTGTSINNLNSLKIHLDLGYKISNSYHILIKHRKIKQK